VSTIRVPKRESRIVVPHDEELQTLFVSALHNSMYAMHFGTARTRAAVGRMFWWESLDKDVIEIVFACVTCQKNKACRHKPYGLFQPLPVPEKPLRTSIFDFIVKLPKTSRGNDSILIFIDKLTKMVHFVACKEKSSERELSELYVDQVFLLHNLSRDFIIDRDPRFTSAFWQGVTELLGTKTIKSSSFHPHLDGQMERVD
jgi:hypothetical protein